MKEEERLDASDFLVAELAEKVECLEKVASATREETLYIQSQSMRNNLLFNNITEDTDERPDDTERKLRKFLVDKLQMAQQKVDDITFERVHRVGTRRQDTRARQIVAKFNEFKEREAIRKQGSRLRGTEYFINEQFPREIVDRRKKLIPRMMAARREGKRAWVSYDTLYIDGKQTKIDTV